MANVYNKPIVVLGGGAENPVDNGMIYEGKYRVRYFDIDGTILKIEYVATGGQLTPPNNPTYDPDYLIFDEWNYDIENYIVEQPTDVGATYKTVDDATYLFIRLAKNTSLTAELNIHSFTSIDWGDGTINTNTSHNYASEGNYVIKIYGNFNYSVSSTKHVINNTSSLVKIYISKIVNTPISSYSFTNCNYLEIISIPKAVQTILPSISFSATYSLKCFIFPKNYKNIASITPAKFAILPQNINTLNGLTSNYILEDITLPTNMTKIDHQSINKCHALKNIVLPKKLTTIGQNVFESCGVLKNIFVMCESIPTLESTNMSTNNIAIWVNDDIIEELKVATNWSNFASYMRPLSWYPSLTNPNA